MNLPYQVETFVTASTANQGHHVLAVAGSEQGRLIPQLLLIQQYAQPLQHFHSDAFIKAITEQVKSNLTALPSLPRTVVVLEPTVAHVARCAEAIRNSTGLVVGEYTRNDISSLTFWDMAGWYFELSKRQVLVFTPDLFLGLLQHQFLDLNKHVSLLIVNEFQMAQVQNHPYNEVFAKYYRQSQISTSRTQESRVKPLLFGTSSANPRFILNKKIEEISRCKVFMIKNKPARMSSSTIGTTMLAIKERVIEFDIAPPTRHISEWRPEEISYSLRYYHSYNERLIGLQSRMQKLQNIPHTASLSLRDPKKIALFNLLEATSKAIEIVQLLKNEFGVLCAGLAAHRMFESIYTKTRASSTNLPVAPGMPFVLTGFSDGFAPMQRPLYSSVTILDFTSKSETLMRIIQKQASPASPSLPTSTAINSSLFSAVIFVREPTLAEHLAYFIEYLRPHLFPKVIGVTSVTGSGLATSTQAKRKRHNTWMSPGSKSFAAINAFINASGVNVLVASNISDKGEIDDIPLSTLVIWSDFVECNNGFAGLYQKMKQSGETSEFVVMMGKDDVRILTSLASARLLLNQQKLHSALQLSVENINESSSSSSSSISVRREIFIGDHDDHVGAILLGRPADGKQVSSITTKRGTPASQKFPVKVLRVYMSQCFDEVFASETVASPPTSKITTSSSSSQSTPSKRASERYSEGLPETGGGMFDLEVFAKSRHAAHNNNTHYLKETWLEYKGAMCRQKDTLFRVGSSDHEYHLNEIAHLERNLDLLPVHGHVYCILVPVWLSGMSTTSIAICKGLRKNNLLPSSVKERLQWLETNTDNEFVPVLGGVRLTPKLAMDSAALDALRFLLKIGELNDFLRPKRTESMLARLAKENKIVDKSAISADYTDVSSKKPESFSIQNMMRLLKDLTAESVQELLSTSGDAVEASVGGSMVCPRAIPKIFQRDAFWDTIYTRALKTESLAPSFQHPQQPLQQLEIVKLYVTVLSFGPQLELFTRKSDPPVCGAYNLLNPPLFPEQMSPYLNHYYHYPTASLYNNSTKEPRRTLAILTRDPFPCRDVPRFPLYLDKQSRPCKVELLAWSPETDVSRHGIGYDFENYSQYHLDDISHRKSDDDVSNLGFTTLDGSGHDGLAFEDHNGNDDAVDEEEEAALGGGDMEAFLSSSSGLRRNSKLPPSIFERNYRPVEFSQSMMEKIISFQSKFMSAALNVKRGSSDDGPKDYAFSKNGQPSCELSYLVLPMIGTPKPEQSNTMDYSDSLPHLPTPSSFTKLSQLIDPPRCSWVIDDGLIESVNHPKPVSLWEWMSGIEKICTDLSNSDQSATCATSKDLIDIVVNNDDDEGKTAFHSSVDGDDRMVENADEAREDEEDVGSNNNNRPSKKSRGPLASIQDEEGLSKVDRRRSNRISAKPDTSNGGRTGAGTASALGLDGFKFEFDFPSSISTSTNTTHVFTGTTASASKAPSFGQKSKLDGFQFGFTMNPSTSSSDDDDNNNSSSNTNSPRRSEQKPSFDSLFNKITSLFDKNKVFTMAEQHLRLESKLITEKIHQVLKQTLVITPHNDHVYELDTLDHSLSALSDFNKKTTTGTTEGKPDKEVEEGGSSSSKAAAVGGSGVSNKSSFKTYSEYFQSHGYQISHPGTPLVSARLSKRVFNLTLPKELSMKSVKESKNAASSTAIANSNHDLVHLIPDCCQVLPFPVELARIAATLPSVLFRMDQYALTDELRQKLELPVVRNETLLSALTSSNALEPYSYERFEFLGDSFLKYSVTTDLYRSLPDTLSEGDLTRKRNELVRNQNLYRIAIQNCLQSFVFLNSLHHKSWMPSWLSRVDCKREVNSAGKLKDRYVGQKLLADIVEALVGAAYMDGGNDVALSLVAKFGLISSKCVVQSKMIDIHRLDSQSQKNEGKEHGGSKWKKKVSSAQQKILVAVEEILDYEYANKENLLEALTHPSMINNYLPTPAPTAAAATAPPPPPPQSSFSSSSYTVAVRRVTRSSASRNTSAAVQNRSPSLLSSVGVISVRRNYQRLEFLGDAIIDWAVARYLFNTFKSASPAILTELRQVAVCNDTFARICVNLGLESYIQHRSSALSNEVSRFSKSALSSASISSIATTTTSSSSSYNVAQAAPKTLGDVIESLAGSVYVDSAFSIVKFWQVFKPILSQMLESYINPTNSYKGYVRMFVEGLQKLGINSAEDIQYSFQHVFENDQGGGGGESMRRVIECTIHLIGANGIRTIVGKAKASTQAWAKREACISGIKWCEENGQSILSKLVEEKMAERGRLFASTPTK